MIYCPQCGHQVSPNQKFCPECGCSLSAQSESTQECDIVCPDCGEVFRENIPAACPNCGCPSSEFQHQKKENNEIANSDKKNKIENIFLVLVVLCAVCGAGYAIYSSIQENTYSQSKKSSSSSSYQGNSTNSNSYSSESNKNVSDAAYKELLRTGEEFERACSLYNQELNMIADKATSSAYSGVFAQKIFWDCDDAFQLVEKKGAAFARAMRKCGQEENARELERRLKADKRKYQSYKDEVNSMLGIY